MAEKIGADTSYICVKALEKGVNIIGVTRGEVKRFIIRKSWIRARF